jgi:DNA-binding IclR family transcriptional regulator
VAENAGSRRERSPIAAVVRVLGALAEYDGPSVGLRELARILDTPPSSVQRTLEAAEEVSLVSAAGKGHWELGWELYRIAAIAQSKRPFQGVLPILEQLAGQTAETALLTVYDPRHAARMFVAAAPSKHHVRFVPELFSWMPAYAGASALAILAFRPEAERQRVYADAARFADRVPAPSPAKIERALAKIRAQGYAVSHDEVNLGASAVAAPVASRGGVNCSVVVIAPNQRFDSAPEGLMVSSVVDAAEAVSRRIGDPLIPLEIVP